MTAGSITEMDFFVKYTPSGYPYARARIPTVMEGSIVHGCFTAYIPLVFTLSFLYTV